MRGKFRPSPPLSYQTGRDYLTATELTQLGQRVATGVYTETEAFDVVFWLMDRKEGYPMIEAGSVID